ncbi:MAG: DHH family phosphoesterase [Candidatus Weimeria sp.]
MEQGNMANWKVYCKNADFKGIGKKYGIDQVTARIIINRDIPEDQIGKYLNPEITDLHSPELMKDLPRACEIILQLIKDKKKIRVIGDYDGDGICSAYILTDGLRTLGADCDYKLPDRIADGYGLNPEMVAQAADDGVEAVITCDNGIAAGEAVELAKKNNLTVIVTDHHAIPFSTVEGDDAAAAYPEEADTGRGSFDFYRDGNIYHLPHADCVVDPHRADDTYPFPGICGAVVAYKLISVLFQMSGRTDARKYLPEAAFATVTDIMELKDENRAIVSLGLKQMARSENIGLDRLISVAGLDKNNIRACHIGFILGPCFNASGRIDSAEKALRLLLEKDKKKAEEEALELVSLNDTRKAMEQRGIDEAFETLSHEKNLPTVIVFYMPDLHESLCGLVAGKIKEKYNRPTFVLCKTVNGDVKGSGRSIEAYPMYDKMVEANEAFGGDGVFTKFGGHPMAAGLSMREEDIDWLRSFLDEHSGLRDDDMQEKVMIDVPMPLYYASIKLVEELQKLEPFGNGNPGPVFADRNLPVTSYRKIGQEKQYRKLSFISDRKRIDGIYFGDGQEMDEKIIAAFGEEELEKAASGKQNQIRLDIIYDPDINDYNGFRSIQAKIKGYRVRVQ